MISVLLILLSAIAVDEARPAPPPPLTAEQLEKVRTLVQQTQADQAAAKRALAEAQQDLARCYSEYKLDEEQVARLQKQILTQQGRLLDTHHRMQQELRRIVGAERFQILNRRIENALRNSPQDSRTSKD